MVVSTLPLFILVSHTTKVQKKFWETKRIGTLFAVAAAEKRGAGGFRNYSTPHKAAFFT